MLLVQLVVFNHMLDQSEKGLLFSACYKPFILVSWEHVQILIADGMFMGYMKHVHIWGLVIQTREKMQYHLGSEIQVQAHPRVKEEKNYIGLNTFGLTFTRLLLQSLYLHDKVSMRFCSERVR